MQAESAASLVADGELLAGVVADGHGVDHATRAHAAELAEELDAIATTLDSADLASGDAKVAARVATVAGDAADALVAFAGDPGDRNVARDTKDELHDLGTRADAAAEAAR
jgi:hypothetical protein